jgi:hypothetical protein
MVRGADAEGGEGHVLALRGCGEGGSAARLGEAVGLEVDIGEGGEGFECKRTDAHAVTGFAEDLEGACVVAGLGGIAEAWEGDGAAGADVVPSIGDAAADAEGPLLRAGVAGEMVAVDAGGGGDRILVQRGVVIARREAGADSAVPGGVDAGDEAAAAANIAWLSSGMCGSDRISSHRNGAIRRRAAKTSGSRVTRPCST